MQYTTSILALVGAASLTYAQTPAANAPTTTSIFVGPLVQVPGATAIAQSGVELSVITANPSETVYAFPCPSFIANQPAPANQACGIFSALTATAVPTGIKLAGNLNVPPVRFSFSADCNTQNQQDVQCQLIPSEGAAPVQTNFAGPNNFVPATIVNPEALAGVTPAPAASTPGATPVGSAPAEQSTGAAGVLGQNVAMAGAAGAFALAFAL